MGVWAFKRKRGERGSTRARAGSVQPCARRVPTKRALPQLRAAAEPAASRSLLGKERQGAHLDEACQDAGQLAPAARAGQVHRGGQRQHPLHLVLAVQVGHRARARLGQLSGQRPVVPPQDLRRDVGRTRQRWRRKGREEGGRAPSSQGAAGLHACCPQRARGAQPNRRAELAAACSELAAPAR